MFFAEDFIQSFYRINSCIFLPKEIEAYLQALLEYLELTKFYKGVIINPDHYSGFSAYNTKTKTIKMNYKKILLLAQENHMHLSDKIPLFSFINANILEVIYHEVAHIFHYYVALSNDFGISPLFQQDFLKLIHKTISEEEYNTYHDFLPIERDANITSIENVLYVINNYCKCEELFTIFFERLYEFMLVGYEKREQYTSPIETLYKNLYKTTPPTIENIDLYDRIKLGFPITEKELEEFKANFKQIALKKNHFTLT